MYIDVHCHLDLSKDIDKDVKNADSKGVGIIVTQGTNSETNKKALELAKKYKVVKVALGFYPIDAINASDEEIDDEIDFIRKNKDKIVAIGEVGLDLKETDQIDKQSKIFQKFIDLSMELDKPIIIHSRKAEKEAIEMLEKSKARKVIMHVFSGKVSLVKKIMGNKWYVTIPTNVKHSEQFQNIVKDVPLSQLLCETDSPYLHPDKKFPNEPANVIESYKKIAELRKITLKEVEKTIEDNYKKLFS